MRTSVLILLTSTLALSACQSRVNPLNWFGNDRSDAVITESNPLIPDETEEGRSFFAQEQEVAYVGKPIEQLSSVEVHRVSEGQLVMAVGVSAVHGAHTARLVPREGGIENGVLTLDFMAIPPLEPIVGGSDVSREITAAIVLTEQQIAGLRTIRVASTRNEIDRRRR